ncbi:MAG: hypothetical protein ACLPKB_24725 [Xanthobacteraceae bacterium]
MRFGLFFASNKRNDPLELDDPRPLRRMTASEPTGDAALDGFTVLSRADPKRAGSPPPVPGTVGPVYRGPDQSFEQ